MTFIESLSKSSDELKSLIEISSKLFVESALKSFINPDLNLSDKNSSELSTYNLLAKDELSKNAHIKKNEIIENNLQLNKYRNNIKRIQDNNELLEIIQNKYFINEMLLSKLYDNFDKSIIEQLFQQQQNISTTNANTKLTNMIVFDSKYRTNKQPTIPVYFPFAPDNETTIISDLNKNDDKNITTNIEVDNDIYTDTDINNDNANTHSAG